MQTTSTTAAVPAHGHEAHGHDGHHSPYLQHHFYTLDQQFEASKLGMWLFLVTEILMFGGMFVAYTIYRSWHPEVFAFSSQYLNPWLGGTNTLVLLASSLTVALAIRSAQVNNTKWLRVNLLLTVLFAGVFLVIKYFEYTHKFHEGIYPGGFFAMEHLDAAPEVATYVPIFFSIYYVMTGIHGTHVLIGMGLLTWLFFRAGKGHFNSEYYTPVEMVGLFWHLVDVIWIFLFPLMYLI